jgi:hypothetical protein
MKLRESTKHRGDGKPGAKSMAMSSTAPKRLAATKRTAPAKTAMPAKKSPPAKKSTAPKKAAPARKPPAIAKKATTTSAKKPAAPTKKPAPAPQPKSPSSANVVRLATPVPASSAPGPGPAKAPAPKPAVATVKPAGSQAADEKRRAATRKFFARLRSLEAIIGADLRKRGSVVLMQAVDQWYSEAISPTGTDVSITNAAKVVIAHL